MGLLCGAFLGITEITHIVLILITLDYFNIDNHITNLGDVLFINLFPI